MDETLLLGEGRWSHAVWEAASDAMALSDAEGRVLAANPAYYVLYGYTPEEVLGQSFAVIFPNEQRAWAETQYREVFRGAAQLPAFESIVRRRDGTERTVEARATFIEDAGRRVAMLSVVRDMTDEVEARRNAARAAEERRAFLDSVSHDLKSPLAALRWHVQLLRLAVSRGDGPSSDALGASLAQIDEGALQLAQLVDELVDVATGEAGAALALRLLPADLVVLAREAAARHGHLAESQRITVVAGVEALLGTWDASRLVRVLDNLLSNALKYSPPDSEVTVRVMPSEVPANRALARSMQANETALSTPAKDPATSERSGALLVVEDHGLGIPANDLPHVFERFRRGGNVPNTLLGMGIGLTSVKLIVEQHGGQVSIDSQEGESTTVSVWLPLQAPSESERPQE